MNDSMEGLALAAHGQQHGRWSTSTVLTASENYSRTWSGQDIPPVPPIPPDQSGEAWARRLAERTSYASQASAKTNHHARSWSALPPVSEKAPMTMLGSSSSPRRTARAIYQPAEESALAELHWEVNALNPHNWSNRKRWLHTFVATAIAFTVGLASSITTLAQQSIETYYGTSTTIATLPVAMFILGLALGVPVSQPCSAGFGRKVIVVVCGVLFALFTLGAGLVQTISGLTVCRFLAGLFASPALAVSWTVVADQWKMNERAVPFMLYYSALMCGLAMGMVLGGFVTQYASRAWSEWVVLFAIAGCVPLLLIMSESSSTSILKKQRKELAQFSLNVHVVVGEVTDVLYLLLTNPTILLLNLYVSFIFAVLYGSFLAFPRSFSEAYTLNIGLQGLTFISMIIGVGIALIVLICYHTFVYLPRAAKWAEEKAAEAEKIHQISNISRSGTSRSSRGLSLKRIKSGGSRAPTAAENERSIGLAIAAANYLNSFPANEGRRILPERIQLLLRSNPAFGDLCVAIEAYQLKFDRVQFAKILVDALPATSAVVGSSTHDLARSQSLHRSAAAAALDFSASLRPTLLKRPQVTAPPPRWRLWPALPASVLLAASLFLFGWTVRGSTPWGVPCFAMGLFAFAAVITIYSTEMYLMERFGKKDGANVLVGAMTLRYLLSFPFPMFATQMYRHLGAGLASSVFGVVCVALAVVPWVLALTGNDRTGFG